jgi:hypothetical protein
VLAALGKRRDAKDRRVQRVVGRLVALSGHS